MHYNSFQKDMNSFSLVFLNFVWTAGKVAQHCPHSLPPVLHVVGFDKTRRTVDEMTTICPFKSRNESLKKITLTDSEVNVSSQLFIVTVRSLGSECF